MNYDDLTVVIPAYNEEGAIAAVINELVSALPRAEIIIIDDGSTDATKESAISVAMNFNNVHVYRHVFNRGYGSALKSGMQFATRKYVAWFDSDNEHRVSDLVAMYRTISTRPLAAVIGERLNRSNTMVRSIGKWLIRMLGYMLKIRGCSDLNCGLRIFRRDIIVPYLDLLPRQYSASLTTTVLMIERQYPFVFHPIHTNSRVGASKVTLKDGFFAMGKVLDLIMLFAPMRIFFKSGVLLLLPGFVYSFLVAVIERQGVPTAGVLVSLAGLITCILGLIAGQISKLRLNRYEYPNVIEKVSIPENSIEKV